METTSTQAACELSVYLTENAIGREIYGIFTDINEARETCQEKAQAFFGPRTTGPLHWQGNEDEAWASHNDPGGSYLFMITRYTVKIPPSAAGMRLSSQQAGIMHAALAALEKAADGASDFAEHVAAMDVAAHLTQLLALLGHPVPGTGS